MPCGSRFSIIILKPLRGVVHYVGYSDAHFDK
jgi:hypothetical protein